MDFKPVHSKRKLDGCIYAVTRKTYVRTKPVKSGWYKIKNNPRENVTIIKLTGFGYTINQISHVLGRSFSFIHKRVRTAITRGNLYFIDKRKGITNTTRLTTSASRMRNLIKWFSLWESYLLGETDRPP
jgi:hypothetical protein